MEVSKLITLSDISATKGNLMIFRKGKTRVIIARYNLMKSGYGYTAFESGSGGEYNFLNEGYGENWWCQTILKISKDKWNSIPEDYKGRWTEYIRDQGFQPELPDEYIGKRTVFEGCLFDLAGAAVLTEGIHFIIEENLDEQL